MCFKIKFNNKYIAYKVANKMKASARIPARLNLRAYFCSNCQAWHLTKMTEQEYRNKINKNVRKSA